VSFFARAMPPDEDDDMSLTDLPWLKRYQAAPLREIVFSKTALSRDISTDLVLILIHWNQSMISPAVIQVNEFREIEKRMSRLRALQHITGILSEFSPEKLDAFTSAVKRKHEPDEVPP